MKALKLVIAVVALSLLVSGCKQSGLMQMKRSRIFLMGRLLAGQSCDVRLIWRQAPGDAQPVTVTADLSKIGGVFEQALTETDKGIWRWAGEVKPDVLGEKTVFVTARDADGVTYISRKRVAVYDTDKVVAFAVGNHSLAVKADGSVVAWGCEDGYSPLLDACIVPDNITDAVAVAVEGDNSIVLNADGTVAAWGVGYSSMPDNDSVSTKKNLPDGLYDVVAVAADEGSSLALQADGTVVAWGAISDAPNDLNDVVAISSAWYKNYALKADGSIVSWGSVAGTAVDGGAVALSSSAGWLFINEYGKIRSLHDDVLVPLRLDGIFKSVAAEARGGVALRHDGSIISWTYQFPSSLEKICFVNEVPGYFLAVGVSAVGTGRFALGPDGRLVYWVDFLWPFFFDVTVPEELQ